MLAWKLVSNFFFFSLITYLTLGRVLHFQTLYITNVSSEREPRYFLIYNYITGYLHIYFVTYLLANVKLEKHALFNESLQTLTTC